MNQVKVLFFATFRELAGAKSADLHIPAKTSVAELRHILGTSFPGLREHMGHSLVAVNREYVLDAAVIPAGAEIALFPPVSGG